MAKILLRLVLPFILILVGCGGGGGGGGGQSDGGGSGPAPAPPLKVFTLPQFGPAKAAVLVGGFQPPGQTGAVQTLKLEAINRDNLVVPRVETQDEPIIAEVMRCGTPELLQAEMPRLRALPRSSFTGPSDALGRFQELAEGARETFRVLTTGQDVLCEKVLEPNETVHCTIFAEVDGGDQPILTRARATRIAEAFDTNNPRVPGDGAYNQLRRVFGSEWNVAGGRDGDTKIVLVFLSSSKIGGRGLFGFFSPADAYTKAQSSGSNEGEFLYLNNDASEDDIQATIAHEFQHMINLNNKVYRQGAFPAAAPAENLTINEGLSVLAEHVTGSSIDNGNNFQFTVVRAYLAAPHKFAFFNFSKVTHDYGQGYLFFRYVSEQFGQQIITDIATDTGVGIDNLDKHLAPGFPEVFRRWTVANYASTLGGVVPAIYRYPSGFRTNGTFPSGTLTGPARLNAANTGDFSQTGLDAWSAVYVGFANGSGQDLTILVTPLANSPTSLVSENPRGTFRALLR